MATNCKICGKAISIFSGNRPDVMTAQAARNLNVYEEDLCESCLKARVEQAKLEKGGDAGDRQFRRDAVFNKIFVSAEPKPTDLKDLGIVTGYCILGTGPISAIASSWTDFFGEESIAYLKKAKMAEELALRMLKSECLVRGGTSVYSCKISLTEATTGHGMLMLSASGSCVLTPDVFSAEDAEIVEEIKKFYR